VRWTGRLDENQSPQPSTSHIVPHFIRSRGEHFAPAGLVFHKLFSRARDVRLSSVLNRPSTWSFVFALTI
jgi:hypothetical protein